MVYIDIIKQIFFSRLFLWEQKKEDFWESFSPIASKLRD